MPLPAPAPIPAPCSGAPASPPLAPEIYNQNNGQPVIIYAYNDAANELAAPTAAVAQVFAPAPAPAPCASPLPVVPTVPAAPVPTVPVAPEPTDLETAVGIADQSISEQQQLESIPAPEQPCKVETSTEIVHSPGETFVHQPGEILINQPPTRLIINHAPYVIRPSAVVINKGGNKITNEYTRKILPSSIQFRPIIVRVVKPIEKKVLIDKPQQPGCKDYAQTPVIPDQCAGAIALADASVAAAPVAYPSVPVAYDGSADISALLAQASADGSTVEIDTDSGPALQSVPIAASPSGCGCGCA